jgi:uncharacterized repeat protein (TIGR04076 family)
MSSREKDWFESVGYEIEVIEAASCRAFHEKRQKFEIENYTTPEGLCMEAFHSMYPLLFAGKIEGNFNKLGSDDNNTRIFNCPSRVVQFQIKRYFQCNTCGYRVNKEELQQAKKEYNDFVLDVNVCSTCFSNLK